MRRCRRCSLDGGEVAQVPLLPLAQGLTQADGLADQAGWERGHDLLGDLPAVGGLASGVGGSNLLVALPGDEHVAFEANRLGVLIVFEVRRVLLVYLLVLPRPGGLRVERGPPLACWGCHDRAVTDTFARLAWDNGLEDQVGPSPEGLSDRYLYSSNMMFRYAFGRWWGNTDLATTAIWVLLNPATGDTEQRHRPTLERCIIRSRAAGHTGLVIVNLFAFRDTNPRNLQTAPDAVGPANDDVLRVITKAGAQTIAAWGGHGRLQGRSAQVGRLLDSPMCLGTTQRGEPRHPLYISADTHLVPWVPVRPGPTRTTQG
jgi:hypothetical protein